MDGEYSKPDSYFLLKKCCMRCDRGADRICESPDEFGVDRISMLPEEILVLILSFLSLREAVTTSVLSSRWSELWKHIPNLYFNHNLLKIDYIHWMLMSASSWDVEKCKYIEMVNSVLQSHKAPFLKELKICLYVDKSAQCTVTKWLEFAFSRQVESLELDLRCDDGMHLVDLEESLRDSMVCQHQNLPFFKSLKRLHLKHFKVSGEALDFFLRNCLLLEKLSIVHSIFTSDIVVCGTTLVLKHLDINYCGGVNSVKVSAPNLTWLRVYKREEKLILENVPKLIGAYYTCTSRNPTKVKDFGSAIFSCISQLKVLSLCLSYPKVFLVNDFPRMPKLKKLVVRYYGVYEDGLLPVTALIWASPCLQEFKLEFSESRKDLSTWKGGLANAERHPHRHLKVLKFTGFSGRVGDHIEFLTYILDNCPALEKIILRCEIFLPSIHSDIGAVTAAARDYAKQQLHGKVPDNIQLCIA